MNLVKTVILIVLVGWSTEGLGRDEQLREVLRIKYLCDSSVNFADYRDAVIRAKIADPSEIPNVRVAVIIYDKALTEWKEFLDSDTTHIDGRQSIGAQIVFEKKLHEHWRRARLWLTPER